MKNMQKAQVCGLFLQPGTGIGDGGKPRSRLRAHHLLDFVEEELQQRIGLQRGSRLTRNDEQGARKIDTLLEGSDLCRIGGIQDMESWMQRLLAKGAAQHLGAQARTAHSQQQRVRIAPGFYVGRVRLQRFQVMGLLLDDVEPTQPVGLVRSRSRASRRVPRGDETFSERSQSSKAACTASAKSSGREKVIPWRLHGTQLTPTQSAATRVLRLAALGALDSKRPREPLEPSSHWQGSCNHLSNTTLLEDSTMRFRLSTTRLLILLATFSSPGLEPGCVVSRPTEEGQGVEGRHQGFEEG